MSQLADEALLSRFRAWLEETRAEAGAASPNGENDAPDDHAHDDDAQDHGAVGLYRLVEEFTALRHEIKLQTRSARGLDETVEKLIVDVRQAAEAMRSIEPREAQAAWSAGKGLALAICELDESLDRGRRQLERAIDAIDDSSSGELVATIDTAYAAQSMLARWLSRGFHQAVTSLLSDPSRRQRENAQLAALRDGYAIIQARLARLLDAERIVRIATLGEPVDPEQMIVLETVPDDGPEGMVVDEVRRGYLWNGKLLRCAEVRATRTR